MKSIYLRIPKNSLFEEILEECNESLVENFTDEIIVEHKEYNLSSVEISIDINHDHINEDCEEHILKDPVENPLTIEILKECEESLFDNYVDEYQESIIESDREDFEIFVGEPIYDSSSDESVISELFE